MADLTTLRAVKQWLPNYGDQTDDDELLKRLISAASNYVETYLNRVLLNASYTSTYNGRGGTRQMLREYPVTAVSQVKVDNVAIPASVNGGAGYVWDQDSVQLIGYTFAKGVQNVSISYTAGYATIPGEIEQSVIELVALRYKGRDRIGIASKGLAGETVSFTQRDVSDAVEQTLSQYKRVMAA